MNLKLEAIVVPVSDLDRAKKFYQEALGFRLDVDHRAAAYEEALGFRHRGEASYRIVQLTPAGIGMFDSDRHGNHAGDAGLSIQRSEVRNQRSEEEKLKY